LTSDNDFEWVDGGLINNDLESKGWNLFSDKEIVDRNKRLIENRKYLLNDVSYIYHKRKDGFKKETIVYEREDKSVGFKIYLDEDIAAVTFLCDIDGSWADALCRTIDLVGDKNGFRIAKKSVVLLNAIKNKIGYLRMGV